MQDWRASVPEEVQSGVAEVAFGLRAAMQDKDVSQLKPLFAPRAQVCVGGRFFTVATFLSRLGEFFQQVGQVDMDIAGVERIELTDSEPFATLNVDFAWIDASLWEEREAPGVLNLTLSPRDRTEAAEDDVGAPPRYAISGFHYETTRQALDDEERVPGDGGRRPEIGPKPSDGGYFPPIGGIWG
jgi:hypothetical protein